MQVVEQSSNVSELLWRSKVAHWCHSCKKTWLECSSPTWQSWVRI